jgi:isoleucyl-tRNA synthetase
MVRLLAPVMSFTADEIWASLPRISGRPESVHLAYFPQADEVTGKTGQADTRRIRADFDVLFSVRDEALKALEIARQEKVIGRPEDATVTIHAQDDVCRLLERYKDDLRFLLIVSGVELVCEPPGNGSASLRVIAVKAPGGKCERCWFYSTQVGSSERYPTVCERCLAALSKIEQSVAM